MEGTELDSPISSATWVTDECKLAIKQRIRNLKLIADHIIEHVQDPQVDVAVLHEVIGHMNQMDEQINVFHDTVSIFLFTHVDDMWNSSLLILLVFNRFPMR